MEILHHQFDFNITFLFFRYTRHLQSKIQPKNAMLNQYCAIIWHIKKKQAD